MIPLVLVLSLLSSCVLLAASIFGYRTSTAPGFFMLHWVAALLAFFLVLLSNSLTIYYFWGTARWVRLSQSREDPASQVSELRRMRLDGYILAALMVVLTFSAIFTGSRQHLRGLINSWHGRLGWTALAMGVFSCIWLLRCLARYNESLQQFQQRHKNSSSCGSP
jgi:TRAP-type C4-dicarboxylate transport system permease small subunit